jgi:hypothetical protein
VSAIAWQFNEAVSLLREARRIYVPDGSTLAAEIDEGLPRIQAALMIAAIVEIAP